MKHVTLKCLTGILVLIVGISAQERQWYPPWPPSSLASAWNISSDAQKMLSMNCFFPYGAVDRHLTIIVSNDRPTSGTARFPNGVSLDLKKGELQYFWEYAGGKEAFAEYRKKGF